MFLIEHPDCGTRAFIDCHPDCPSDTLGYHVQGLCVMADPDAALVCPPGSGCCEDDHSGDPDFRGHALLRCETDHSSHACPNPGTCRLWASAKSHHAAAKAEGTAYAEKLPDDCPGGHHGEGVEGCKACRSLVITAIPGTSAAGAPVPAAVLRATSGG